jgi:hypothetical protein
MFEKRKGFQKINIQGLECWIPPVGKVYNHFSKKIEEVDIIQRSPRAKDQWWEPIELPLDWAKRRRHETNRQQDDPDFFDPELETLRRQEWGRRINGCWFMNNGVPTYLTGLHYYYLNYYQMDIGHPHYRDTDRKEFYFLQYCIEDPNCYGMLNVTRRRAGKTYKAGAFLLEGLSRLKRSNGGIQSKTSTDAKKVFRECIVAPFRKLPDFFRPVFDTAKGVNPTSELRFFKTVKKGAQAMEEFDANELESTIDYKSSDVFAYDGYKLKRFVQDEVFKTVEVDVLERWDAHKFCLEVDGRVIGKALLTSTVEEIEGQMDKYRMLWEYSDHLNKNANGRTKSGLYRYFTPAQESLEFDEYGICNVDKATTYLLNERDGLRQDMKGLSSFIRKFPMSPEEAFRIDADKCLYDSVKLNNRLDEVSWQENLWTRGNFEWENGERDTRVIFVPRANGKFKASLIFEKDEHSNRITSRANSYAPNNNLRFVVGCDPFDHDITVDGRRSDGAAYVFAKYDVTSEYPNNTFVCQYIHRPPTAKIFYEDILKMCVYYGCQMLFEDNKIGIKGYFEDRGYGAFLMWLPNSSKVGLSGSKKTHQQIAEVTEDYIVNHIDGVVFKELIVDWLNFDINNTTKFDAAMAAGYTLIADRGVVADKFRSASKLVEASSLFKKRKIR